MLQLFIAVAAMTAATPMSPNTNPPTCSPEVAMFNLLLAPFLWTSAEVDSERLSDKVRLNREGPQGLISESVNVSMNMHACLCVNIFD